MSVELTLARAQLYPPYHLLLSWMLGFAYRMMLHNIDKIMTPDGGGSVFTRDDIMDWLSINWPVQGRA